MPCHLFHHEKLHTEKQTHLIHCDLCHVAGVVAVAAMLAAAAVDGGLGRGEEV